MYPITNLCENSAEVLTTEVVDILTPDGTLELAFEGHYKGALPSNRFIVSAANFRKRCDPNDRRIHLLTSDGHGGWIDLGHNGETC
jgi:hypothetical protein